MRYAIVINLDYNSKSTEECKTLWLKIRDRMIDSGFRLEGRLFTTEMDPEEARDIATEIIESLNQEPPFIRTDPYSYLKEFYGYDHTSTINLLLPPTESIHLDGI